MHLGLSMHATTGTALAILRRVATISQARWPVERSSPCIDRFRNSGSSYGRVNLAPFRNKKRRSYLPRGHSSHTSCACAHKSVLYAAQCMRGDLNVHCRSGEGLYMCAFRTREARLSSGYSAMRWGGSGSGGSETKTSAILELAMLVIRFKEDTWLTS